MTHGFVAACLLAALALASAAAEPIDIRERDVIAFIGGSDLVRMQQDGRLEAALTQKFLAAKPRFRDLAWEGDTVEFQSTIRERWRQNAFGNWRDQLERVGATMVIVQFGKMESLGGETGLAGFVDRYDRLLDDLGTDGRRIIILEPSPFEWKIADAKSLRSYTDAIRKLAGGRSIPFVSLGEIAELQEIAPATLTAAVKEKHRLWYDYWRPANWKCLFGDDGARIFSNAAEGLPSFKQEWETFPALIAAAEETLWNGAVPQPRTAPERNGSDEANIADELAAFEVMDGYEVNLFADESQGIANPLSVRWDADGRMFVACSDVYPQIEPGVMPDDKVILLEDTDADGNADKSSVFASGLSIPTGMEVGPDGVYVGHNTELAHFDWNGNRRRLLSGFGNGDSHQTINSFTWSPDGDLWFCQGDGIESRVETPHGVSSLFQAGVHRLRPGSLQLDPLLDDFMGPGNPWGIAFDDFGQSFVVDGAGGISYLTPGSIPAKRRLPLPRIGEPGGYCGVDALGDGSFGLGDYKKNQVTRFRTLEDGGGFKVEFIEPLLRSKHRNFRPVDVKLGPDGAIYVVDWYNPITCHQDDFYRHPIRDRTHGRIWRVKKKGTDPQAPQTLTRASDGELIEALKSPNRWTRTKAKQVLTTRGLKVLPAFAQEWSGRDLLEAVGLAVWCGLEDHALVKRLLASDDHRCRAYAARIAGRWQAFDLLEVAAADTHPRVRMEALLAAGQILEAHSILIAAAAAELPRDRWIDYAFKQAVHHLKPLWMEAFHRGELDFGNHHKGLAEVLEQADPKALRGDIRNMLVNDGFNAEVRAILVRTLIANGNDEDLRFALELKPASAAVLRALANRDRPNFNVNEAVLSAVTSSDPDIATDGMKLAANWKVEVVREHALKTANSTASPARPHAIRVLGAIGGADAAVTLKAIALRSDDPLHATALRALFEISRESGVAAAFDFLTGSSFDSEVGEIFTVVSETDKALDQLFERLEARGTNQLIGEKWYMAWIATGIVHEKMSALLNRLAVSLVITGSEYSERLVTELVASSKTGDPGRGEQLFKSAALACFNCHRVGDQGGVIGPDLSAVGSGVPPERIVTEVLWPARQIKEGFSLTHLILKDNKVLQGYIQKSRNNDQVLLRDFASGQIQEIRADSIRERNHVGSLMPPTARGLSREELGDLLSYLIHLRGQP